MNTRYHRRCRGLRASTLFVLITFSWLFSIRAQDVAAPALSDPVRMFNDPNSFATAQLPLSIRPDSALRNGAALRPPPIRTWITGDTGEVEGRNFLEAGFIAEFLLRRNARYPLIVTIPASTAMGDELYFFGPHFAYISTGLNVRMPLSFIPSRYGRWTAGTNADFCFFGTTAAEFTRSVSLKMPRLAAVFSVDL